jgi:hypothetical protein
MIPETEKTGKDPGPAFFAKAAPHPLPVLSLKAAVKTAFLEKHRSAADYQALCRDNQL